MVGNNLTIMDMHVIIIASVEIYNHTQNSQETLKIWESRKKMGANNAPKVMIVNNDIKNRTYRCLYWNLLISKRPK